MKSVFPPHIKMPQTNVPQSESEIRKVSKGRAKYLSSVVTKMTLRYLLLVVGFTFAQHPGSQKENEHLSMKIQECSSGGSCKDGTNPEK